MPNQPNSYCAPGTTKMTPGLRNSSRPGDRKAGEDEAYLRPLELGFAARIEMMSKGDDGSDQVGNARLLDGEVPAFTEHHQFGQTGGSRKDSGAQLDRCPCVPGLNDATAVSSSPAEMRLSAARAGVRINQRPPRSSG